MHVNRLSRRMWPGAVAIALFLGVAVSAQNPPAKPPAQAAPAQTASEQVIRTGVELITTDAIVRDSRGLFIADLKKEEFEIYEDGVKQQLVSFTLTHGGRVYNVAQVHNRRKAFIYVSNGYDFNPFQDTRTKQNQERYGTTQASSSDPSSSEGTGNDPNASDPFKTQGNKFYQADLVSDLSWLTRNANRANVTMYTIDPRGLVGMPDLDEKVDMMEWQAYVRTSQDSLRTIAELTGGYAAVNQNDFDKALKRIDAETSDYYVIGYYSNNPDPTKRNRSLEVKVTREGLNVMHRKAYTLPSRGGGTAPSK
jgi:hypothetical protein